MITALARLSALAQETRLSVFRLLVTTGPDGCIAGEIAAQLGIVQNTLSAHLAILQQAGLVTSQRQGRAIRYTADMDGMQALLAYLLQDCCGGRPDLCQPLLKVAACGSI